MSARKPERGESSQRRRVVVWEKVAGYGVELVDVALGQERLEARGLAIGWQPVAYQLEFDLATTARWVTSRLAVRARGDGWRRSLELERSSSGGWSIATTTSGQVDLGSPGGNADDLAGSLDCDLGLSPLTNSMPVLRSNLLRNDGSLDFVMAWVSVPDLAVRASPQRYTRLSDGGDGLARVEYRSLDGDFVSVLTLDADGLVVDYPQLARRVP